MSSFTSRIGLTKPAGTEKKQLATINANYDKLDGAIGSQWVTDGSMPSTQYDGAILKEVTSGKEYVLRTDGLGGYTKRERQAYDLGVINHYSNPIGSLGTPTIGTSWTTIPGSGKNWTASRDGIAFVRVWIDCTMNPGAGSLQFRASGLAESAGPVIYTTSRISGMITFTTRVTAGGTLGVSVDAIAFISSSQTIGGIQMYVDTNAVLT